jgi:3-methyladenine DNA glycosylase AlkD
MSPPTGELTAARYVEQLSAYQSEDERRKLQRYFKSGPGEYGEGDVFLGVRMGQVFALSKAFIDLPPDEIEKLLENPLHEVRAGGLSIMAKQAAARKTPESRRQALFELYLRRMDRINNWDLVDVAAPDVVGRYLFERPRDVLYRLAASDNLWERRTAIYSTLYFLRQGDVEDTFKLAELLLGDDQDLIHKATGGLLREAGKKDRPRLLRFLDQHAATMPRTLLRYAIEHLDTEQRGYYMGLKKGA